MPDWRTRHCAEPAIEAVAAARGCKADEVWAELGGCPRSWREGRDLYRRIGVRSLREATSWLLGPEIDRKLARRGDIVMVRGALGVCRGELAECMGVNVPMREVETAWPSTNHGRQRSERL